MFIVDSYTTTELTRFEDVEDQEGVESISSFEQKEPSTQREVSKGAVPTLPSIADTEAATAWHCHKCRTPNVHWRKKCSACKGWKGGKHTSYNKKSSKAHQDRQKKKAEEVLIQMADEQFFEEREMRWQAAKERIQKISHSGKRTMVFKTDDTPLHGNLSVSQKQPSSSAHKLEMEIQVGYADPDFTSALTRSSSFESVGSIDTQVTAAEVVRAKGLNDDEDGDGGASDAEGEGDFDLDELNAAMIQRCDKDEDLERDVRDDLENFEESVALPGAPEGWIPPQDPEGWVQQKIPKKATVPPFQEVDNPAGWTNFPFRARFTKSGEYKHHAMPAGAIPVPKDWSAHLW